MALAVKNIIFDLDGTLVNSSEDIIESLRKAYAMAGVEDVQITANHVGPKLDKIIAQLTPGVKEEQKHQVMANYRNIYDGLEEKKSTLYHKVEDVLKELLAKDYRLFVATNKPQSATIPLLNHFRIDTCFTDILTPTSIAGRDLNKTQMVAHILEKYAIEPTDAMMIGDHADDIQAAKANGLRSVAVLYGYSSRETMLGLMPDLQIDSFPDILNLL